MTAARRSGGSPTRKHTRRTVLAGGAALLAGSASAPGPAAAQATQTGVIPRPEQWPDENLAGFIIHLGPSLDPQTPGDVPSNCQYEDWPPETKAVYDGMLVNRKEGDTPEESTNLIVSSEADFRAGQLFLINTFEICEGEDYVGVELEQIGYALDGTATGPVADVEDDERPNENTAEDGEGSGAIGPGFGPVGTLLAVAGLGGWFARRREA